MEDLFRDGILNLNTRQFGTAVELIVVLLNRYKKNNNLDCDLIDPETNKKIEVKSSRVYKKQSLNFTLDNLYDLIVNNTNRNRLLRQDQVTQEKFDCNIQQVKTDLFDTLYYLLFFYDVIEVFKIENKEIQKDVNLNYSNRQHRGNEGEGQFHITQKNYKYHRNKYFIQSITYEEIKKLLLNKEYFNIKRRSK